MSDISIVYKSVDELHAYENNPRINDSAVDVVANSINEFGFKVPMVIDNHDVIVTGHTRLKACKKLGIKKVPCIIADDLSEEQIRAFRLADNKVAEKADWDYELLDIEIESIDIIDMEDFGFEYIDVSENAEATQDRVENILNVAKANYFGVGKYDIPQIEPCDESKIDGIEEWIGFNYVLSDENPENKAVHFFLDDYQFERLWKSPERYCEKLKQYRVVLSPDFSPFADMPMATQIFNHYRKHWVAKYLQENGVNIVPTIRASKDERSFEWYLDGEPSNSVVCISNMWSDDSEGLEYFMEEFEGMVEKLSPSKIFVYGRRMEILDKYNVEYISTFADKRWGRE